MTPSPFLPSPPPSPSKTSATSPATKTEASDADKDGNATNATHNLDAAINPSEETIPADNIYNDKKKKNNHNHSSINDNNINIENNDFLSQAIRAHQRLFQTHVQTTLHYASSQYLHRLLTHRLRVHLQENFTTQEWLSRHPSGGDDDDDIGDALTLLASKPLPVRKEDVDEAYALAGRIGEKWAEVLLREGYDELAEAVRGVVRRGRFLEGGSREREDGEGSNGGRESETREPRGEDDHHHRPHGREDEGEEFLLPYSKLTSLRRYPPDCDGSGRPMRYLPIRDVDEPSSSSANDPPSSSSARKVIRQIDSLAEKGETMWSYGWDVILEAVERNRRRNRRRRGAKSYGDPDWEEEYEVVPKDSSIGFPCNYVEDEDYDHDDKVMSVEGVEEDEADEDDDGVADSKTKQRKKNETSKKSVTFPSSIKACNHAEETINEEIIDKDFLISTHKISAAVMSQRERQEKMQQSPDSNECNQDNVKHNDQKVDQEADTVWEVPQERGRPPSTLEREQWTLEDVRNCMTQEERTELVRCAIHPPYPYECDNNDDHDAIVSRAENMDNATGDSDEATTTNVDHQPNAGHSNNKANEVATAAEEEEPPPKAILCGALKPLGSIHLWEETRHLSKASSPYLDTPYEKTTATTPTPTMPTLNKARTLTHPDDSLIYGAAEAVSEHEAERLRRRRAKALRKATKERIGYRVPKVSEEKVERGCGASSKAVWTRGEAHEQKEGGDGRGGGSGGSGRSGGGADVGRSGGLGQVLGKDEKQMWLELDLGECVMESTVDDDDDVNGENDATHNNNGHGKKRKRMMAFRSVEIALKNWPIQITKSV